MSLYRGSTGLCCLKDKIDKALDCGEIGLSCNRDDCIKAEDLYQDKPHVNFTFGQSSAIEKKKFNNPSATSKLGSDASITGYTANATVTVDIYARRCKGLEAFCQASQVESWILQQLQAKNLGVINSIWVRTAYAVVTKGEQETAWFSMTFTFEYARAIDQPNLFGGCLK